MKNVLRRPFYSEFGWAYDLLIQGPIQSRCDFFQVSVSRRGVLPGSRILDAGCGTGEYAIELAHREYEVTGLDASRELVSVARRKVEGASLAVKFQVGDILDLPSECEFNAILCRGVLNDFIEDADRQQAFFSFARALRTSGVLVLDAREWHATACRKTREPIFSKTVESARGTLTFHSSTRLDRQRRRLLVTERHVLEQDGVKTVREYDFVMCCWTKEELQTSLTRAGFGSIAFFGDYDLDKPLGSSERVVAVASLR